jgi:hypothetical protein
MRNVILVAATCLAACGADAAQGTETGEVHAAIYTDGELFGCQAASVAIAGADSDILARALAELRTRMDGDGRRLINEPCETAFANHEALGRCEGAPMEGDWTVTDGNGVAADRRVTTIYYAEAALVDDAMMRVCLNNLGTWRGLE